MTTTTTIPCPFCSHTLPHTQSLLSVTTTTTIRCPFCARTFPWHQATHQKESTKCASALERGEAGEQEASKAGAIALAVGGACIAVAAGASALAMKPNVMQNYTLDVDKSAVGDGGGGKGPVEEMIVEFERKVPFRGFSPSHLFPNEPNFRRGDGSSLALSSKADLLLPAGWTWLDDDWSILTGCRANASGTDEDGWMYAFNWAGESGYAASGGMKDCVRKRIWIRRRAALPTPDERATEEDLSLRHQTLLPMAIVGAGSGPGGVEGERGVDGDLKDLFEKYGFSVDVCARVCEELGADVVSDLKVLEKEDVQALTWLKPIQQRKLLSLISDTQV